jgi:hypothetical protein
MKSMKFFSESDLTEAALILLTSSKPSAAGLLGGVKRRAKNRAIIRFCSRIEFEDISLTAMRHFMRQIFGVSVSNLDLMRWATPGRKANDRVNIDILIKNISPSLIDDAQEQMQMFEQEWKVLLVRARAMISGS